MCCRARKYVSFCHGQKAGIRCFKKGGKSVLVADGTPASFCRAACALAAGAWCKEWRTDGAFACTIQSAPKVRGPEPLTLQRRSLFTRRDNTAPQSKEREWMRVNCSTRKRVKLGRQQKCNWNNITGSSQRWGGGGGQMSCVTLTINLVSSTSIMQRSHVKRQPQDLSHIPKSHLELLRLRRFLLYTFSHACTQAHLDLLIVASDDALEAF